MTWGEFCTLLAGIMPETPLGQIVTIRSENDKERLKSFTPEQRRIRSAWRSRPSKQQQINPLEAAQAIQAFQELCRRAFG